MDKNQAEALSTILMDRTGQPDPRSWGEQYVELSRIHRKGSDEEIARSLQRLYRNKQVQATQERMISVLEEKLFPPLGRALEQSLGALRSKFHRGQPAFGVVAPERPEVKLPDPPPLGGKWEPIGAFRVFSGSLACGEGFGAEEPPGDDEVTSYALVKALDGVWFHYACGDERALAVHESAVGEAATFPDGCEVAGTVFVEGATIPIVDEEVRLDRYFQREIEARQTAGRSCTLQLCGDGNTEVLVRRRNDRAVLVGFNDGE